MADERDMRLFNYAEHNRRLTDENASLRAKLEIAEKALDAARPYVTDALEAHEHSDGRDVLASIDAALAAIIREGVE